MHFKIPVSKIPVNDFSKRTIYCRQFQTAFRKMMQLPFNTELFNGTLKKEMFLNYVRLDSFYLIRAAKAAEILMARYPNQDPFILKKISEMYLEAELSIYQEYLQDKKNKIKFFDYNSFLPIKNSIIYQYSNYLITSAEKKSFPEGLSAFGPCLSLYYYIGIQWEKKINNSTSNKNPYEKYLNTYFDPHFRDIVIKTYGLLGELFDDLSEEEKENVSKSHEISERYELKFATESSLGSDSETHLFKHFVNRMSF